MKRRRLDTGKENLYSLYDTILSAHWVRRCSGKVSDGTSREVEMSAQKILAYHSRKAMNCWLRTNGRWFYGLFSCFFFSDWNVLLYLWSHVPYRYWNNLSIHTVRTAGKSHSHILTHGKNYAYIKSTLWNFWIWDSLICLSAWCSNSRRANIFFVSTYPFRLHLPYSLSCPRAYDSFL